MNAGCPFASSTQSFATRTYRHGVTYGGSTVAAPSRTLFTWPFRTPLAKRMRGWSKLPASPNAATQPFPSTTSGPSHEPGHERE